MKKSIVFLAFCLAAFASCAGSGSYRQVYENTLYSRYMPENEIQVADSIQYIGNMDDNVLISYLNEVHTSGKKNQNEWFFVECEQNANKQLLVKRGLTIIIEELAPNSRARFVTDSFSRVQNYLDKGRDVVLGRNYDWIIIPTDSPLPEAEAKALESKGYVMPKVSMTKYSLRKISGRGTISIIYYECVDDNQPLYGDIAPYNAALGGWDGDFVAAFNKRAGSAAEIREYTGEGLPQSPQQ
ncbi:hypothetical protein SAMN02745216_04070 [Desulfatibacillum alkenivorans DSM 16219]|uniref:Lipoprotein n=1 Tax=Desulfatibacillum alkenivorans DSM 16219 TaxID=1121393 RepID=A0A1M6V929_9BACT|nr:hypothetical protein [Desulfatibacillum alkenivorans]SHK77826.1 hypothetical protein SAMN02745216_04070 [Desulfatibacillum alkenivorans DSM 16219]